jgi:hypothetical protein
LTRATGFPDGLAVVLVEVGRIAWDVGCAEISESCISAHRPATSVYLISFLLLEKPEGGIKLPPDD